MFSVAALSKVWERFSPWAAPKENPVHADFRRGIECAMQDNNIEDARMVGGFFQVGEEFMDTLYQAGFRTAANGRYDFDRVVVFVADIDSASIEQELTEGSSIAFIGTQDRDGSFQLLNVSNYARSDSLDVMNSYTARKAANGFRNLLNVSGEEITPEFSGMYEAPTNVSHVAPVTRVTRGGQVARAAL